jgi:arginyl-tRNA synthetase
VQYAHARLASVFREADKAGLRLPEDFSSVDLELLSNEEMMLAKKALGVKEIITAAIEALEPHRIPFYLLELAGDFHRYYNKPANRIIDVEREAVSLARLFVAKVLKDAISGALGLLGVNAPERM